MTTPKGGMKKTKQQRKEALFKKKRLRSVLSHKVQSLDMGLYPADTDSSDDDLFTGNVWWEGEAGEAGEAGEGGKENPAFEPEEKKEEAQAEAPPEDSQA